MEAEASRRQTVRKREKEKEEREGECSPTRACMDLTCQQQKNEKKGDGSAGGVGEVSGRKWRPRLSSLRILSTSFRFSNRAELRVQRRIPVFEDEDEVDTGSEPPFHHAK